MGGRRVPEHHAAAPPTEGEEGMTARELYAAELEATFELTTPGLVRAFATVPREAFLGSGPWTIGCCGPIGADQGRPSGVSQE